MRGEVEPEMKGVQYWTELLTKRLLLIQGGGGEAAVQEERFPAVV